MITFQNVQKKVQKLNNLSKVEYSTVYLVNSYALCKGDKVLAGGCTLAEIDIVLQAMINNLK